MSESPKNEFEDAAERESRRGFVSEFWQFLKHNKKWWLLPIVITLLLLAVFVWLSSTAAAPFIYTLF
jgi:drug/metabolite transporter superfamily protein YnfA